NDRPNLDLLGLRGHCCKDYPGIEPGKGRGVWKPDVDRVGYKDPVPSGGFRLLSKPTDCIYIPTLDHEPKFHNCLLEIGVYAIMLTSCVILELGGTYPCRMLFWRTLSCRGKQPDS